VAPLSERLFDNRDGNAMKDRSEEFLAARVARLESSNRRLTAGIGMSLGIALLLVTTAAGAGTTGTSRQGLPADIEATSFRLLGADGTVRAALHDTELGPRLELYDESGTARASLEHGPEGTALYLRDDAGTTRIGVAQFPHGGGGFAIHGERAEGATVLYMSDGRGRLTFYAADGTVIEQIAPPTRE